MTDISKEVEIGVLRRRNDTLMLQQITLLQESVSNLADLLREQESRISHMEEQVETLTHTIIQWRTERNIVLGALRWLGSHGRAILLVCGGVATVFYERIVSALSQLIELLSGK